MSINLQTHAIGAQWTTGADLDRTERRTTMFCPDASLDITETADGWAFQWMPAVLTPFLGEIDPNNAEQIVIGRRRANADYEWNDSARFGSLFTFAHGSASLTKFDQPEYINLSGFAGQTVWVYYDLQLYWYLDSALDVTLSAQAGLMPEPAYLPEEVTNRFIVILGKADVSLAGVVTRWRQYQLGNIELPFRQSALRYRRGTQVLTFAYMPRNQTGTAVETVTVPLGSSILNVWFTKNAAGAYSLQLGAAPTGEYDYWLVGDITTDGAGNLDRLLDYTAAFAGPMGESTTFLQLIDTPSDYTGQADKYVRVEGGTPDELVFSST